MCVTDDLWNPEDGEQEEPDWVEQERQQFSEHRDKNGNGRLEKVCTYLCRSEFVTHADNICVYAFPTSVAQTNLSLFIRIDHVNVGKV